MRDWTNRTAGTYDEAEREYRHLCGQDPEEDYIDRLIAEFDATELHLPCRLPQIQGVLFNHGSAAA